MHVWHSGQTNEVVHTEWVRMCHYTGCIWFWPNRSEKADEM